MNQVPLVRRLCRLRWKVAVYFMYELYLQRFWLLTRADPPDRLHDASYEAFHKQHQVHLRGTAECRWLIYGSLVDVVSGIFDSDGCQHRNCGFSLHEPRAA